MLDVLVGPIAEGQRVPLGAGHGAARQTGFRRCARPAWRPAPYSASRPWPTLSRLSARSNSVDKRDQLLRLEDADHVFGDLLARIGRVARGRSRPADRSCGPARRPFAGRMRRGQQQLHARCGRRRTDRGRSGFSRNGVEDARRASRRHPRPECCPAGRKSATGRPAPAWFRRCPTRSSRIADLIHGVHRVEELKDGLVGERGGFGKQRILRVQRLVLARQPVDRGGFKRPCPVALHIAQRHEDFQRLIFHGLAAQAEQRFEHVVGILPGRGGVAELGVVLALPDD